MIAKRFLIFAFILQFNCIYSQVTIGTIEKPKEEEKIVLKPIPYDSSKDIDYQEQNINYNQHIGLQLYLTPNGMNGVKGDKYYTIIDVFYGKRLEEARYPSNLGLVFMLRDNNTKDTINWGVYGLLNSKLYAYKGNRFTTNKNTFILVPYFVKQKQLYQNHYFYSTGDEGTFNKWLCTDVSILRSCLKTVQHNSYG